MALLRPHWAAIALLVVLLAACRVSATAEFSSSDFEPAYEIAVRKADLPFIKCDVCKKLVEQLNTQVEREKEKAEPKKVSELKVIEVAEKICDVKSANGGWITRLDIVESGEDLRLIEHDEDGECLSECKTIERACQEIIGYHDTDLAERIFNDDPSVSALQAHVCHEMSDACDKEPGAVPEDREPGENWRKKDHSPPDYSKMAKNMNIPTSVMHDEAAVSSVKMPKGMGMPEEVMKRSQEKAAAEEARKVREAQGAGKKKKSKKGKKGKKGHKGEEEDGAIDGSAMADMLSQAQGVAKGGSAAATEFVHKMTGHAGAGGGGDAMASYDEL